MRLSILFFILLVSCGTGQQHETSFKRMHDLENGSTYDNKLKKIWTEEFRIVVVKEYNAIPIYHLSEYCELYSSRLPTFNEVNSLSTTYLIRTDLTTITKTTETNTQSLLNDDSIVYMNSFKDSGTISYTKSMYVSSLKINSVDFVNNISNTDIIKFRCISK